jgi:enamine deaminase RidA (YjgF/YER057c/UK114 family)
MSMLDSGRTPKDLLEEAMLGSKVPTAFGDVELARLLRRSNIFLEGPNGDLRAPTVTKGLPERGTSDVAQIIEAEEAERGEPYDPATLMLRMASISGQLAGNTPKDPKLQAQVTQQLSQAAITMQAQRNTITLQLQNAEQALAAEDLRPAARSEMIITPFLKALDSSSSVMGGEVARVVGGQSRFDSLVNSARQWNEGGALPMKELRGLVQAMRVMEQNATKQLDQNLSSLGSRARAYGVPPDQIPGMVAHFQRVGIDPQTGIPVVTSGSPEVIERTGNRAMEFMSPDVRGLFLRRGGATTGDLARER